MRIAMLSDFHAGGEGVSWPMLRRARQIALEFEPDLLVLTGDYFDDGRFVDSAGLFRDWPECLPVLGVLGNHDWRSGQQGLDATIRELEAGGVRLLRNESVAITLRGVTIYVAGVDDPHLRRDDLEAALRDVPDSADFRLLLSHSPSVAENLLPGQVQIVLAGHTHGGQIRLLPSGKIPFIGLVRRMRGLPARPDPRFFRGCHWVHGSVLVISDGLGLSTIRARFRTRPQVILIELGIPPVDGPDCDEIQRYVENISNEPRIVRQLF